MLQSFSRRGLTALIASACVLTLVGCPAAKKTSPPTAVTPAGGGDDDPGNTNAGTVETLQGSVVGFSKEGIFAPEDAAKFTVVLKDESGTLVPKVSSQKPAKTGTFLFTGVPKGVYFVEATLPDKSMYISVMATTTGNANYISMGSTLVSLWYKEQLNGLLIFLESLDITDFFQLTQRLNDKMTEEAVAFATTDEARLTQFRALVATDPSLTAAVAAIEKRLKSIAEVNLENPPVYADDKEYAAKKKRLGL